MTVLVKDILRDSMSKIGAVASDEEPIAADYALALRNANYMLDAWSVHGLMIRGSVTEGFALTAAKASYTIGVGKDFNTAKPIDIIDAYIRDSANEDYPIEIVSRGRYDSYTDKAITPARPEAIFYDPGLSQQSGVNFGTIYTYPIPNAADTLYLVSDKYLTEFVNLTDAVTFEKAYYEAILYNLAVRIFPDFKPDKQLPPLLLGLAKSSKKTVELMNHKVIEANVDIPGSKGGNTYNIYSDRWY